MPPLLQFLLIALILTALIQRKFLTLPIIIPLAIFIVVCGGCIYISYNPEYVFTGGGIRDLSISSPESLQVFALFRNAVLALAFGYFLSKPTVGIFIKQTPRKKLKLLENSSQLSTIQEYLQKLSVGLVFLFLIFNLREILERNTYLLVNPGSIIGALRYLIPFAGILNLYFLIILRRNSIVASITYAFCLVMEFSFASRSFGVLLATPFLLLSISVGIRVYKIIFLTLAVFFATLGISTSLLMRKQPNHGLINYLSALDQVFGSSNAFNLIFGTYLVIIPVTLIGLRITTPDGYVFTSFNPMPGRMTDWYSIAPELNINRWTPSGAIAQLHNSGIVSSLICWALVGFMIGACSTYLQLQNLGEINSIILSALSFSASLQFLQYSLRPGLRFVYAMALFALLAKAPLRKQRYFN